MEIKRKENKPKDFQLIKAVKRFYVKINKFCF